MKVLKSIVAVALFMAIAQGAFAQVPSQAEQEKARHEQLRIAVQDICHVSGQKLGTMGAPVKVAVGEKKEEIYLCCKGCANKKIDPKHWATIHTNIAKAQGKCPVMKNDLPKTPKWTIVNGQIVYVCCPGCDTKIQADPTAYLRQVDAYYLASLKAKRTDQGGHADHAGHVHRQSSRLRSLGQSPLKRGCLLLVWSGIRSLLCLEVASNASVDDHSRMSSVGSTSWLPDSRFA